MTCKEDSRELPHCRCKDGFYDAGGVCKPLEECSKMEFHKFDDECTACKISCHVCPEESNDKCAPSCSGECTQDDLDADENCRELGCVVDCGDCEEETEEGKHCEDCLP